MNKLGKYVNALFLLAGAIVWLVSRHYIFLATGYFQLARKVGVGAEVLNHALPLVLGIVTFLALRSNAKATEFSSDSLGELARVSWPTAKDVRLGTIVVIITVVVAGIFLGMVDIGFSAIVRGILGT